MKLECYVLEIKSTNPIPDCKESLIQFIVESNMFVLDSIETIRIDSSHVQHKEFITTIQFQSSKILEKSFVERIREIIKSFGITTELTHGWYLFTRTLISTFLWSCPEFWEENQKE